MYCKKCGKFLAGHINYCSNCGTKVEHDAGEDRVKVFAPVDEMRWDDRDDDKDRRREPIQHDYEWSQDPVYARIAEARRLREQRIPDVEVPSTDILEKEMEGIDTQDINRDEIKDSREKIEKFYTFSKKREEFQKLLDKEQERIERKNRKPEQEERLSRLMDFDSGGLHDATDEVERTQAAQMARARRALFGDSGMDDKEWDQVTDRLAEERKSEAAKQKQAEKEEELRIKLEEQNDIARKRQLEEREKLERERIQRERLERSRQVQEQTRLKREKEEERQKEGAGEANLAAGPQVEPDFAAEKDQESPSVEGTDKTIVENIEAEASAQDEAKQAEVVFVDTPKTVEVTEEGNNEEKNDYSNHSRSDDSGSRTGSIAESRDVTQAEGKASAETNPQGEETDSQGATQEPGGGEEAGQAGTKGEPRLAKVIIDPEVEKEKSEKQAKAEEFWKEDIDDGRPRRGKLARFFIGLLSVVIFVLACLICIRLFMPNSMVAQYMDKGTSAVYSLFGKESKKDVNQQDVDKDAVNNGMVDKSSLISLEQGQNYNGILGEINSDVDLKFTEDMVNEHAELADLTPLDNKLFKEGEGTQIFMDQAIVGRTIDYMSKSKAYIDSGDDAVMDSIDSASDMESVLKEQKRKNIGGSNSDKNSISIGEIRQKGEAYYVLLTDTDSHGEAMKKVLEMRVVGNKLLVSNRLELD